MKPTISEHDHQATVIQWCDLMAQKKFPMLKWIYAVPNAGKRSFRLAQSMKNEGMKAGVPDLCLPYPIASKSVSYTYPDGRNDVDILTTYHGLFIEMKTKGGTLKPHQKEWIEYLISVGYKVMVAWTAEEAITAIEEYLE